MQAKRGLSEDRIVAAAAELADADGLEAVSMARVAERLGFTPMSLYRHVAGKDELLRAMLDAALGPPPAALDDPSGGWRAALELWTHSVLAALLRHPWAINVPISGPPMSAVQLAWLDRGLRALEGTKLTESEKADIVLLLNGYAFWEARLRTEVRPVTGGHAGPPDAIEAMPALRRALEAGIFEDESVGDRGMAFGLGRILDGVEVLIAQDPLGKRLGNAWVSP
jgi:AcrR family transcriptional regulator